ncbi:MAG: hypothetical protein PHT15_05645 [Gallionellaceae bacterium]|nr:hypothetical protein [Gallionellaceae bacterium]
MRITPTQAGQAVAVIRDYLGTAEMWLFGSRVYDARHGGNADLYARMPLPGVLLHETARASIALEQMLGHPVGLMVNNRKKRLICQIAREAGVRLR